MAFVSMIEPKNLNEAIIDDHWIVAMQEEEHSTSILI